MTLEDFFTLSELKDGLTTPARVNELLTVMRNEKDSVVKNVGETTRQWSAVASTIASTVNKECLDLFIQLDGLWFIDRWLNDAQKFANDTGDGFLEELIVSLLRALERLQVDKNTSVASGIKKTVDSLLSHSSSVVCEKAKTLCDSWTVVQDIEITPKDAEKIENEENDNEENVEQTRDRNMVQETDKEEMPTQETVAESATVDSSNTSVGVGGNLTFNFESNKSKSEEQSDASQLDNKHVEDAKEKQEIGVAELTNLSSPLEHNNVPDSANVDNASESATKTETREESSAKDEDMVDGGESPEHHHSTMDSSSESENPKTTSNTESEEGGLDAEVAKKDVGIQSEGDSRSRSVKGQDGDMISKRPSDMELDYGIVDPLELARQVANEVEREVDSQERSCSSSQNISCSVIKTPNIPDLKNEKEHRSSGGSSKEISSGEAEHVNDVETNNSKMESGQPEIPQISKRDPESEPNAVKGLSGFDLNEEVSSEEIDRLPVAPLQFNGRKGSAATVAFRPFPEVENIYNSKQSLDRLDFDLNVAEDSEDKIEDLLPRDKMPMTSFLPSGEDKMQLDLNSLDDGDSGTLAFDWKLDSRIASLRPNGPQSSSSSIQPSFRTIDLNFNESFISIFGAQVEVKRKDPVPSSNGRVLDPAVEFSLGSGSSNPYATLPAYGPNTFPIGPAGSFASPMYGSPGGPIPYMVDPRGTQIIGMPPSIPPAFSQPAQPFLFNMAATGITSGSNVAGPSRHNLDLNPGFMTDDGNRENNGGLRQFFVHNQGRPVDEQYLRMSNSASSVIGGKRQEPDSGWDPFPVNYKHQHPPWQ